MAVRIPHHYHYTKLSADQIVLPAASVTNDKIEGPVDHSKVGVRYHLGDAQSPGSAVVAKIIDIFIARAAGAVLDIDAAITGALADDASRHVTVDLQKCTGGGSFTTMLTGVIDITEANDLRTAIAGVLASTSFAAGDVLRLVVAVSGGSGNQAQGLRVSVTVSENPL